MSQQLKRIKDVENDFIATLIPINSESIWLGIDNINTGSTFVTSDGDLLTYTNWNINQQNNGNNLAAVEIKQAANWAEVPLHWLRHAVCLIKPRK